MNFLFKIAFTSLLIFWSVLAVGQKNRAELATSEKFKDGLYNQVTNTIDIQADIFIASAQNSASTTNYNDPFYQQWNRIKLCIDIGSGVYALPTLAAGAIKVGNYVLRNARGIAFSIAMNRAIRTTNFINDLGAANNLAKSRAISYSFATGEDLVGSVNYFDGLLGVVNGAGSWLDDLDVLLGAGTKTKITGWINTGLSESKLETAFANTTDKAGLLNKLETSKSIYLQRVHIADWDNIPGIAKSNFTSNGLSAGKTHPAWNNPALDLPSIEAANFVNATAVELPAGTKIYRVTGGNPAGGYWTIQKPNSVGEVIGGTAVQPAWNDFSKIYVYEVPQGQTLKVWQGTTAKQPIEQGIINPIYLEEINNYLFLM